MRKQILFAFGLFCSLSAIAQQPQTPATPTDPTTGQPNPQKGTYAWYRGGNINTGNPATNSNVFGTAAGFNSPIYTVTNGVTRTKLNGDVNYTVNGFNAGRNGFLFLGPNSGVSSDGALINNTKGAFSQLHLHGISG